jgi:hypothetical protein
MTATEPAGVAVRPADPPEAFLEVRDLRIHFPTDDGLVKALDGHWGSSASPAPASR